MKTVLRECVDVRNMQKSDIEDVLKLLKKTGLFFEPCDTNETYERMLEHNPQSVLVMTYNESMIEMVIIVYSPLVSIIYHGCVTPKYQRQGLGTVRMCYNRNLNKKIYK